MAAKEIADGSNSVDDGFERDPCPICLGTILQESYLDTCFHKFCFKCIKQWIKVVSSKVSKPKQLSSVKCPLCKTENLSVIHNYDGHSFDRHYINLNITDGFVLTKEQRFRLQCYYTESGFLADVFDVPRFWKLKKILQPNRYMEAWLRRELQTLMQDEDVDIVLHHLVGVMDSFCKRIEQRHKQEARSAETIREQFKSVVAEAARPFLMARTDRFVDEVELFLASGLNMEAYDAVYKQRLSRNNPRGIGAVNEAREEEEQVENRRTRVIPYLFVFDEDSD